MGILLDFAQRIKGGDIYVERKNVKRKIKKI